MMLNTGADIVPSKHGLLTTVCYKFGDDQPSHRRASCSTRYIVRIEHRYRHLCFGVQHLRAFLGNAHGNGRRDERASGTSQLARPLSFVVGSEAFFCIARSGALVHWLRGQFGLAQRPFSPSAPPFRQVRRIIRSAAEVEDLARTVDDNGGVYFVPAFSGLFAPHWNSGARVPSKHVDHRLLQVR